jgi:hypothetical protein
MATPVVRPFTRLVLTTIASSAIVLAGVGSFGCGDASTGRSLGGVGGGDDVGGGDTSGGGSGATPGGGNTGGGNTGGGNTGGGNTGGGTTKPSFAIAVDKAAVDSELQTLTDVKVTLTPKDGFTGAVTLATTGLPTGATGVFTPASVNVTGTAPVTAALRITTPSTVTPTATPLAIKVTGTGGAAAPGEAALTYNVKGQITITIPQNVAQATDPFGASDIVINSGGNPVKVLFLNKDSSKDHIVHSTNTTNGFAHGDTNNPIPLDGMDTVRTVTGTGRYPFYMHDGENTPSGAVKIN